MFIAALFVLVGVAAVAVGWIWSRRAAAKSSVARLVEEAFVADSNDFEADPDAWSHFPDERWRANVGAPQWREWHAR